MGAKGSECPVRVKFMEKSAVIKTVHNPIKTVNFFGFFPVNPTNLRKIVGKIIRFRKVLETLIVIIEKLKFRK